MTKANFLSKLKKENKLELVDPSEEIKESYIKKSESSLVSAKILFDNEKLEEAIALSYYSMYYMITALLFKTGIKCENHSGTITLMKELFDLENSEMILAKSERIDKQYYTDFHITKEQVKNSIKNAETFNGNMLEFISKLNNKDVLKYRERFKELVK